MLYALFLSLLRPSTLLLLATAAAIFLTLAGPHSRRARRREGMPRFVYPREVTRHRRRRFLGVVTLLLITGSLPLTGQLALGSLEWHYPRTRVRPDPCPAIVVLGGWLEPLRDGSRRQQVGEDSVARALLAAELYHAGRPCPVLVCGGVVSPPSETTIAEAMTDLLVRLDVRRSDISIENRSRSTHENAVMAAEILAAAEIDTVVLVTDALHLRRAELCFRRQGIMTLPRGTRYRAGELRFGLETWIPSLSNFRGIDAAAHEWLGLLWYRLRGRI